MGIDAKGRNFSAPRLTPGKHQELMTYGSPNMLKDQERQIAVMEDRARRYGYMSTAQASQLGGVTARALGTSEGYNRPPVTTSSSFARAAANNYSRGGAASSEDAKKVVKVIIVIIILFNFLPIILGMLAMAFEALKAYL